MFFPASDMSHPGPVLSWGDVVVYVYSWEVWWSMKRFVGLVEGCGGLVGWCVGLVRRFGFLVGRGGREVGRCGGVVGSYDGL